MQISADGDPGTQKGNKYAVASDRICLDFTTISKRKRLDQYQINESKRGGCLTCTPKDGRIVDWR